MVCSRVTEVAQNTGVQGLWGHRNAGDTEVMRVHTVSSMIELAFVWNCGFPTRHVSLVFQMKISIFGDLNVCNSLHGHSSESRKNV